MNTHAELKIVVVAGNLLARMGLATFLGQSDSLTVIGQMNPNDLTPAILDVYRADVLVWMVDDDLPTTPPLSELGVPILFLMADNHVSKSLFIATRAQITENASIGLLPQNPLSVERIESAIHALADGLVVIDPALLGILTASDDAERHITPADDLTPREMQVLQHMAEGLPNKQIARELGISPNTVKFHVNAILSKLDAQSRTEAVIRATQLGWVLL